MKGRITKPFLIALFLILLLAPGIAFIVILSTDKLVTLFTEQINVAERYNYYFEYFKSKYQIKDLELTKLLDYLIQVYGFDKIASIKNQLVYSILGLSLVILGILIILGGAFFLNNKWKTRKALIVALLFFWVVTITGFGLLAVGQYKYQWTNEAISTIISNIKDPENILVIYNPYEFSEQSFQEFIMRLFDSQNFQVANTKFQTLLFNEFTQPLINLKGESNNWIKEIALWWVFLIQAALVSLIVAFEYTSYASHLVKPNYIFLKRERLVLFGQTWFKKVWTNLKEPTIWNVLRISIILITLFILIEVILIIATLANKDLNNLYEALVKFPYAKTSYGDNLILPAGNSSTTELFIKLVVAKIYYNPVLPAVFIIQFVPILGLSFLVIIWTVSFVLLKRFSYLSKGSIVLFYLFFLPILFVSLFLFTYSQTSTNNLVTIANEALDAFKAQYQNVQIRYYKASLFGDGISNTGEWILFAFKVICVLVFSGIISFLLWKIYKRDALTANKSLPKFITEKNKNLLKKRKKNRENK